MSDDARVDGVTILDGERMIEGVTFAPLRRIPDERGTIMHMLRRGDPHFVAIRDRILDLVRRGRAAA